MYFVLLKELSHEIKRDLEWAGSLWAGQISTYLRKRSICLSFNTLPVSYFFLTLDTSSKLIMTKKITSMQQLALSLPVSLALPEILFIPALAIFFPSHSLLGGK